MDTADTPVSPWPIDMAKWMKRARVGKFALPQMDLAAMAVVLQER